MSDPQQADTPTVHLKPNSYQPSKAELEEPLILPGNPTPEQLAKALMRSVKIVHDK